jgi:hypothetical protein
MKAIIGYVIAAAALVACLFAVLACNNAIAEADARVAAVEKHLAEVEAGEWKECGMCGAHVHDWWWTRNADNTEFVPVCEFCYQLIIED